jgi:hypothetical protein
VRPIAGPAPAERARSVLPIGKRAGPLAVSGLLEFIRSPFRRRSPGGYRGTCSRKRSSPASFRTPPSARHALPSLRERPSERTPALLRFSGLPAVPAPTQPPKPPPLSESQF